MKLFYLKEFAIVFLLMTVFGVQSLYSQFQYIGYNKTENTFEGGVPLPANERFYITGEAAADIALVEAEFYGKITSEKTLRFKNFWRRFDSDSAAKQFKIDIYDGLPEGANIDILLKYYKKRDSIGTKYITDELTKILGIYVSNNLEMNRNKYKWASKTKDIIYDLNKIIKNSLSKTIYNTEVSFDGLSDLTYNYVDNINGSKASDYNFKVMSEDEANAIAAKTAEIVDVLLTDIKYFLNENDLVLAEKREIIRYPMKKSMKIINLNAGYGFSWFKGGLNEMSYGHSPYVGFAIPFTKKFNAKPFWKNLSFNVGVYILDFKDQSGSKYTGPVIKRPYYFNLGYSFFRFLKVQGGMTLLEKKVNNGNFINTNEIMVRPNISLGIEFGAWFGKKK
jgi:hypothetical protein